MKTISFANWKGGVGKTTISENVAFALAESWQAKVLFIDADKQGNSSSWFNADLSKGSLSDILENSVTAENIVQHTRYKNIDLIPASPNLLDTNLTMLLDQDTRQDNRLQVSLQNIKKEYDVCIIDTPPDSNWAVTNALKISDFIIAVATPSNNSLAGVKQLQEMLNEFKSINMHKKITGVIMNKNSKTTACSMIYQKLEKEYYMFPSIDSGRNTENYLNVAEYDKQSIFEYKPRSKFARQLVKFIENFEENFLS